LGGASTIDSIMLVACRRGRVTRELVEVVHAAAGLVVGAMVLLTISGTAFFLVGVEATPKFWAKMVIVGVACLNGLVAHRFIFPLIENAAASGSGFLQLRPWSARVAAASAAISSVSWSGALILGAWHGLKLGMTPILVAYVCMLAGAIVVSAVFVAPRIFVFTPESMQRRRVRSIRDVPAAAALAISLSIADASLAIATRLRQKGGWTEPDSFDGFSTDSNAMWSDQLISTDASNWSFETDGPVGSGIADVFLGNDYQHRGQTYRGWPSYKPGDSCETSKH
jgi:hypothetical protein